MIIRLKCHRCNEKLGSWVKVGAEVTIELVAECNCVKDLREQVRKLSGPGDAMGGLAHLMNLPEGKV
jgi:hypothetical protein